MRKMYVKDNDGNVRLSKQERNLNRLN